MGEDKDLERALEDALDLRPFIEIWKQGVIAAADEVNQRSREAANQMARHRESVIAHHELMQALKQRHP